MAITELGPRMSLEVRCGRDMFVQVRNRNSTSPVVQLVTHGRPLRGTPGYVMLPASTLVKYIYTRTVNGYTVI